MNRRDALKSALAVIAGWTSRPVKRHVGPLDVRTHGAWKRRGVDYHVYVHGRDVTNDCYYVDDTPRYKCAYLFLRDRDGRHYLDPSTHAAAYNIVTDGIEIRTA